MGTSRLEAFSDGVLAIIITIMVLELREPVRTDLASLWHTTGPGLLSYLLSFVYVGIYWTNHHHMFQLTARVTGGILWANLGLLFFLSLFPFTTQWMETTRYARTPVVVYGVNLLLAALAYYALPKAIGRDIKGKVSPVFYIAGALAALLGGGGHGAARPGIWIAVACYVGAALLWVIPDRRIERSVETTDPARPEAGPEAGPEADSLGDPSHY